MRRLYCGVTRPLLLLLAAEVIRSVGASQTTMIYSLDLSGHHNLQGKILAESIEKHLSTLVESSTDQEANAESVLEVDVSSSALGDKGLQDILHVLLPSKRAGYYTFKQKPISINFIARMNQLTPEGIRYLIESMMVKNESNVTQEASSTEKVEDFESSSSAEHSHRRIESLDLCWNHLHPEARGSKGLQKSLQKLIENPDNCPTTLRLDRCGIGPSLCRSIGKGLLNRYGIDDAGDKSKRSETIRPLSLYLSGNSAIGNSGAAALAAAIRTIVHDEKRQGSPMIFETLDLSACGIGDAGAEALALAINSAPSCCIRRLDLSNNKISHEGAIALGHAMEEHGCPGQCLHCLDLSSNRDIGDRGASALAASVEKRRLSELSLRSCHVHADGAAAFGKALRVWCLGSEPKLIIDLSGNPLGTLRGKSKKDGGKYSASRLKSTATASAASYMNKGVSFLKKGLKDVGMDISPLLGSQTAESDDEEEEEKAAGTKSELMDDGTDLSIVRCGAKALVSAFLETPEDEKVGSDQSHSKQVNLGLRHCFFDHGAADALAAMLLAANDEMGIDLTIDVDLNPILEEEMVAALHGDAEQDERLQEMAERYQLAMEAIRESRERATEAAAAASAPVRAQEEFEAAWEAPGRLSDEWDSDAEYDDDEDDDFY